jgi:hypothetical protein
LTDKTTQLTDNFIMQIVGKTLHWLQCLGDSEHIRQVVAAWTPEIEQCNVELRVNPCEPALYGLEHAVVTALYGLVDGEKSRISLEEQVLSKRSRKDHPPGAQHVDKELHEEQQRLGNLRGDWGDVSFCAHPSEMRVW